MQLRGFVVVLGTIALLSGCGNQPQVATSPTASPSPVATPSPTPTTPASPTPSPSPSPVATSPPEVVEIERRLATEFNRKTDITPQSLTCPGTAEIKQGSQFECEAAADGQNFTIAVEITNSTGPQFIWSTRELLLLSKVESTIQDQIKAKNGGDVTATCGGKIRTVKQGDSFNCQVSNTQGQSRSVRVTVKDEQGSVDITLI